MENLECECFNKNPEFIDEDYSTCINCGKLFDYNQNLDSTVYNLHIQTETNYKKNQKDLINTYINNIQKNFKINFKENVKIDIIYLFNLSTETYKYINNYKKIKYHDNFCYLSSLYVLKNYNELDCINKLLKLKPKNINKFNRVFYFICNTDKFKKDYKVKHNIKSVSILHDDYSWIIYEILEKNYCLEVYEKVYDLVREKLHNDEFISKTNFEKYILNIINKSE
jgi:hypothetical protein